MGDALRDGREGLVMDKEAHLDTSRVVLAYHQRSKHHLQRFAAGPDTLDWDAQPSPFRIWVGAPLIRLPLVADELETTWAQLHEPSTCLRQPMNVQSLACLLELSFGLTAWKQFGPDRWALRANPSSGNLHPTEVYVLALGMAGLDDGLYHYEPLKHALACRARYVEQVPARRKAHGLWIGLSSIHWREAWKYGERAFRYCQLDAGHALGAVRYAAAALGWSACRQEGERHEALASCMGLNRDADFGSAEREEPEMLIGLGELVADEAAVPDATDARWFGQASLLDPRPMYRWPVIEEVAQATRLSKPVRHAPQAAAQFSVMGSGEVLPAARHDEAAATIIRNRRSAQHFDKRAQMSQNSFEGIVRALLPSDAPPWDVWPHEARVHPIIYVYRVEGVAPGVYVLPRSASGERLLRREVRTATQWAQCGALWRVGEHEVAGALRQLSCHQAIASDACFSLSLVAEFEAPLEARADAYRLLLQEAGLIGQALYLHAEAQGYRGTGIGCYFDDAVHHFLGMEGTALQALYHFTVGVPVVDNRITTELPYAHLGPTGPSS